MFKWLMALIFNRVYFKYTIPPEGDDYGCIMWGYSDKNHVLHITKTKYIKPNKMIGDGTKDECSM